MQQRSIIIEKLPFYWRLTGNTPEEKNVVPDFLPFELHFDDDLGLLIQKRDQKILDCLETVYQEEYNIGNIQDCNHLAKPYGKDFLDFIDSAVEGKNYKSILEIGCGGSVLLGELKQKGFNVLGIDPSPYAKTEGDKRGVEVIVDFFPSKQISQKFDVIFHSDVLEHVTDPVGFLKTQYSHLEDNGIVIISTPDCTESIENGDISMVFHQHLNYHDMDSLRAVINAAGFVVESIVKAKYGGSLYAVAKKGDVVISDNSKKNKEKLENYFARHEILKEKIGTHIKEILADKEKTLGIYAPIRVLPYLASFNLLENPNYRFFDDTPHWHSKYFDGINVKIENFEDLKENPVTDLLIMSPTFGSLLENKVKQNISQSISIKKLTDFYKE